VSGKIMAIVFEMMKKKINQAGDALEKVFEGEDGLL
jgi:hypothetical protein